MSKREKWDIYLLTFSILAAYVAGSVSVWRSDFYKAAVSAVEDCQKDLPRNQFCKLTAKVKDSDK